MNPTKSNQPNPTKSPYGEIIDLAIEKISQGFCQHYFAEDARGIPVSSLSLDASCFCIMGAINYACWKKGALTLNNGFPKPITSALLKTLKKETGEEPRNLRDIANYNDTHTQADAIDFLRSVRKEFT